MFLLIIPLAFGLSAIVMLLWNNALLPAIPALHAITYWQALGILVLFRVLFGGRPQGRGPFGRGPRDPRRHMSHLRRHMEGMNEEQRKVFIEKIRRRMGRHAGHFPFDEMSEFKEKNTP